MMYKPIVFCNEPRFCAHCSGLYFAFLNRTSPHPILGEPKEDKRTRTSAILRIDFVARQFETVNTIYRWGA